MESLPWKWMSPFQAACPMFHFHLRSESDCLEKEFFSYHFLAQANGDRYFWVKLVVLWWVLFPRKSSRLRVTVRAQLLFSENVRFSQEASEWLAPFPISRWIGMESRFVIEMQTFEQSVVTEFLLKAMPLPRSVARFLSYLNKRGTYAWWERNT